MKTRIGMLELAGRRLRDGSRRGVILVLSTFLFIVMFAFAAFAIDLGYIVLTAQQLQNAADAACLSAVLELKGVQANLSRAEIKEKALLAAQETALKNRAGGRFVKLYAGDMKFGNRSVTNVDTGQITTVWEGYGESGTGALNAVSVDLQYGHGNTHAGREPLGLFFARVIGTQTASVDGAASSHLTPRDLVFVIDVSGSMLNGSGFSTNYAGHTNMLPRLLGNLGYVAATIPTRKSNDSPSSVSRYNGFDDEAFCARFYPPRYPQRVAPPVLKGNYRALWHLCCETNPSAQLTALGVTFDATLKNPNIDMDSSTPAVDYLLRSSGSPAEIGMCLGATAFGTVAQRDAFLAQEFPGLNPASNPWNHWKWRAFCDFCFITNGSDSKNAYEGLAGQTKNLNLLVAPARSVFANPPSGLGGTPTLASSSGKTWRCVDMSGNACPYLAPMGVETYVRFATWSGFIPAVRGQDYHVRDLDGDGNLDVAPTGTVEAPQPSYMGYYPMPKDLASFDKALLFSGGVFHGTYPGDLDTPQITYVRRGTLHGIHAMIEQESTGGSGVAYNKVGMVLYGTRGYVAMPLTNDLDVALKIGVSRVVGQMSSQLSTNPRANANTNWGSGMREAVQELTASPRYRSFSQKSIVMLTDGEPNQRVKNGNHEQPEILANGTINFESTSADNAEAYGRHWAVKGYNSHGIITHAVGFNISVGGTADQALQRLAGDGRGVYRNLTGDAAGFEQLKKLFVDIAKDKLGKLYLGE